MACFLMHVGASRLDLLVHEHQGSSQRGLTAESRHVNTLFARVGNIRIIDVHLCQVCDAGQLLGTCLSRPLTSSSTGVRKAASALPAFTTPLSSGSAVMYLVIPGGNGKRQKRITYALTPGPCSLPMAECQVEQLALTCESQGSLFSDLGLELQAAGNLLWATVLQKARSAWRQQGKRS